MGYGPTSERPHRWRTPELPQRLQPHTAQVGSAYVGLQTLFRGYPNLTPILLAITERDAKLPGQVGPRTRLV